jgi:hypothetical protein
MSVHGRVGLGIGVCLALSLAAAGVSAAPPADAAVPDAATADNKAPVAAPTMTGEIQAVADALRLKLEVPQAVTVALVPKNPLMASVEPAKESDGFVISIEEPFAGKLTAEEMKGVLAHELGHVWIYTHHPFLQTEAQANRVAMRLVSRETLEHVYEKVWKDGVKGDPIRFFGPPSAVAAKNAAQ